MYIVIKELRIYFIYLMAEIDHILQRNIIKKIGEPK